MADERPVLHVDHRHPVVLLCGHVEAPVVGAEEAVVEDTADILQLVDRKVGLAVVDAPHLPGFFQGDDDVWPHQVGRDVVGDGHAGLNPMAVHVIPFGGDRLERLQGIGPQDDRRGRVIVAGDDVLPIVGNGQAARVEPNTHLDRRL